MKRLKPSTPLVTKNWSFKKLLYMECKAYHRKFRLSDIKKMSVVTLLSSIGPAHRADMAFEAKKLGLITDAEKQMFKK